MTRSRIAFIPLFSLFMLATCSRSARTPVSESAARYLPESTKIASVDVVKATTQPVDLAVGSTAEATVHLTIQNGYHIIANPPSHTYLKATELEVPASDGISVGFITYPNPIAKQFSFADKPLAVYEGETPLKIMLKADKSVKKSERSLAAKLRVQACDDQVCYPPGVFDLSIPVRIK
jgi:hypothetical protein